MSDYAALSLSTELLAHHKERSYSRAMSMKARAAAQAMSEESLATRADIARLEWELSVVKWMTGAIVAGVISLLLKSFAG